MLVRVTKYEHPVTFCACATADIWITASSAVLFVIRSTVSESLTRHRLAWLTERADWLTALSCAVSRSPRGLYKMSGGITLDTIALDTPTPREPKNVDLE